MLYFVQIFKTYNYKIYMLNNKYNQPIFIIIVNIYFFNLLFITQF